MQFVINVKSNRTMRLKAIDARTPLEPYRRPRTAVIGTVKDPGHGDHTLAQA
ncbi:MAG: hypothetical protein U0L10_00635 [Lachnospiraceae bacterium]|nr:hypothetical protein [Lachnospiraceae bacterium]